MADLTLLFQAVFGRVMFIPAALAARRVLTGSSTDSVK
jgi:hypothetical protein